ncbi:hypothetical protein Hypma_011030 [Hypsizygus marmoreus]|uniref:Uncharacterized protein n=1 Tax=Hypsizygus marmoreus TaxID=39966 RepID=A0A369JHY0_HYPMA|nr:hypothetical protein Hypma_011030 [Hypsizygus marmoreus]
MQNIFNFNIALQDLTIKANHASKKLGKKKFPRAAVQRVNLSLRNGPLFFVCHLYISDICHNPLHLTYLYFPQPLNHKNRRDGIIFFSPLAGTPYRDANPTSNRLNPQLNVRRVPCSRYDALILLTFMACTSGSPHVRNDIYPYVVVFQSAVGSCSSVGPFNADNGFERGEIQAVLYLQVHTSWVCRDVRGSLTLSSSEIVVDDPTNTPAVLPPYPQA